MRRWKSGARGCRRGRRASGRAGSSALLCLCNGKNPLGYAQENIKLRSPSTAKLGPAGRGWGGTSARDGAMAVRTPRPLALLCISPNVGKKWALPTHPQHHRLQGSETLRRDAGLPSKVLHLP